MIIINVEPQDLLEEKHVCYFTRSDGENVCLYQVTEQWFQHPDGPAKISKYDTRLIQKVQKSSFNASAANLLEAAQNNCQQFAQQNLKFF